MNNLFHKNLLVSALVSLALTACSPEEKHDDARNQEVDDHEGHVENKVSDLDLPVADLFAASCEHSIQTYECDDCRYEVGVVKASANLFDGGLLKTVKPKKKSVTVPLTLTGEVQFDERRVTHVSTQTEGIIRKVHVMLGDKVEPGQPLIEFESVAVGDAEATYLEARGILKLASRNHDRVEALRKEAISSEKELLLARQELDAARQAWQDPVVCARADPGQIEGQTRHAGTDSGYGARNARGCRRDGKTGDVDRDDRRKLFVVGLGRSL